MTPVTSVVKTSQSLVGSGLKLSSSQKLRFNGKSICCRVVNWLPKKKEKKKESDPVLIETLTP